MASRRAEDMMEQDRAIELQKHLLDAMLHPD